MATAGELLGQVTERKKLFPPTYGEFLDMVEAERRSALGFDDLVAYADVVAAQSSLAADERPYQHLVGFVPPNWERRPLRSPDAFKDLPIGPTTFGLAGPLESVEDASIYAAGGAVHYSLYNDPVIRRPKYIGAGRYFQDPYKLSPYPGDVDYYVAPTEHTHEFTHEEHLKIEREVDGRSVGLLNAREYHHRFGSMEEDENPRIRCYGRMVAGVMTYYYVHERRITDKQQFIMRSMQAAGNIPARFDLGGSSVIYDRQRGVRMSWRGALTAVTNLEYLDLGRRSTTFGSRIQKYYNTRGVGIVLPYVDPEIVAQRMEENVEGFEIETMDLIIRVLPQKQQDLASQNLWRAAIELKNVLVGPVSDYDESGPYSSEWFGNIEGFLSEWAVDAQNVKLVLRPGESRRPALYIMDGLPKKRAEMRTAMDIVSPDWEFAIRRLSKAAVSRDYKTARFQYYAMKHILEMSDEQISCLESTIDQIWDRVSPQIKVIRFGHLLQPFIERAVAKFKKLAPDVRIDFWITEDPSRQHTASLNPAIVDFRDWYGDWWGNAEWRQKMGEMKFVKPAKPEEAKSAAEIPDPQLTEASQCALCLEYIIAGQNNTVTLPCGHSFHWTVTADEKCGGYSIWHDQKVLEEEAVTCPMCRGAAIVTKEEAEEEKWAPSINPIYMLDAEFVPWAVN